MKNKNVEQIKQEFDKNPDLIIKKINQNFLNSIYIIFLETVSSSDKINDYILKNITHFYRELNSKNLASFIPGPNTILDITINDVELYLTNGFTLVLDKNKIIAIETKGELTKGIENASIQKTIMGPQESFTENYQASIGQIKRRLKSKKLKTEDLTLGRYTQTKIGINYVEGIADYENVRLIKEKLSRVDIDGIIDSSIVEHLLHDETDTVFPTIKRTERPDVATNALLEGKIVIVVDTSPFVLILPSFFIDFINPISDNYQKSSNVKFLKILRLICFLFSMTVPALYIALINYNQETIPTSLLVNFASQRNGVPFPSMIEAIIMLLVCEILRECDLRFPSNFGTSISVLGALIMGDAAVNAGIVSPIMIIIVALTFITSLLFTELEINNALRNYRFTFLFFSCFLGLYGLFIAFMIFLINILSIKSLNKPYFAPIMPYNKVYFNKTLNKVKASRDTKRSNLTTNKNFTKGKFK